MQLLFRLTSFETKKEVREYFENILLQRDNNCFFNTKKLQQIELNETIYFSFESYIIVTATFMDEIIVDTKRDEKFIFGHKLSDIKLINSNEKLNIDIVGTNTVYLNSKAKLDEIKRVMDT